METDDQDRILLGEFAALSSIECSSRLQPFLTAVAENLVLDRPQIARELLNNGLEKDDAVEVKETLRQIADGYSG